MIQNYMETLVANVLKNELKDNKEKYNDICRCHACAAFIAATALNNLPPFYVTRVLGEVYGEFRSKVPQNHSDILVAVGKGMEALKQQGGHRHA